MGCIHTRVSEVEVALHLAEVPGEEGGGWKCSRNEHFRLTDLIGAHVPIHRLCLVLAWVCQVAVVLTLREEETRDHEAKGEG